MNRKNQREGDKQGRMKERSVGNIKTKKIKSLSFKMFLILKCGNNREKQAAGKQPFIYFFAPQLNVGAKNFIQASLMGAHCRAQVLEPSSATCQDPFTGS